MFLTRNLKTVYEFIVIPRFTSQLVSKKGDANQIMTQIEVIGRKFDDVNRNNINRDDVIRRNTVDTLIHIGYACKQQKKVL